MKRDFSSSEESFSFIRFFRVILLAIVSFLSIMYKSIETSYILFDMMVKAFLPENQFQTTMEAIYEYCGLRCFFVLGDRKEGIMLEKLFKLNVKQTSVKTEVIAGITTFLAMAIFLG